MQRLHKSAIGGVLLAFALVAIAFAAGPEAVQGPGASPECFKPWGKDTKYYQWKKKSGPYRIALDNGFIGNTWRIQMIKTAKAYAEQPGVKEKLKEFKVISTGEDLPAQIAAANNLIDAGYDAVIVNALNPAAFAPVAKKAKKAGVVLLSFDNVIESTDNIVVNVDQVELGRLAAKWLLKEVKADGGKLLEVRGPSGNSVDRDRHDGLPRGPEASRARSSRWSRSSASGTTARRRRRPPTRSPSTRSSTASTSRAARRAPCARCSTRSIRWSRSPGETENGFRKLCAAERREGAALLVGRDRPGPGRRDDQGGDRRARGREDPAVDLAARVVRRVPEHQGRLGLLSRRCPITSSSATRSRAARSGSRRRRSWASRRPTSSCPVTAVADRPGADGSVPPLLRMEGISKRYGGVRALDGARLECARGRIHAVLGENGAGKSTLIKVLAGVVRPDAGTIELDGQADRASAVRRPRTGPAS